MSFLYIDYIEKLLKRPIICESYTSLFLNVLLYHGKLSVKGVFNQHITGEEYVGVNDKIYRGDYHEVQSSVDREE